LTPAQPGSLYSARYSHNRERKCADAISTIRFSGQAISCAKILIYVSNKIYGSNFIKPLGNFLWLEITKMLIAVQEKNFIVSFIISFGTLSFSIVHVLLFIGPCVHHCDPFDEKTTVAALLGNLAAFSE